MAAIVLPLRRLLAVILSLIILLNNLYSQGSSLILRWKTSNDVRYRKTIKVGLECTPRLWTQKHSEYVPSEPNQPSMVSRVSDSPLACFR